MGRPGHWQSAPEQLHYKAVDLALEKKKNQDIFYTFVYLQIYLIII